MPKLHPDRYSSTGVSLRKRGVVIHDSESGDGSSASLIAALQRPGDRPLGAGRMYGSGYAAVTDGAGGYVEMADASMGPYHAPPANKDWWSICIPGRASQTREEWLDTLSLAHIRGVARYIVDKAAIDGFPIHRLSVSELLAGDGGYCDHDDISDAWGQTNHYDVGPNFPWDILDLEIQLLITPPAPPPPAFPPPTTPEDTVHVIVAIKHPAPPEWAPPNGIPLDNRRFAWDGISIRHIPTEEEYLRLYVGNYRLFKLHPNFASLDSPYLMTLAEIRTFVGGEGIS